MRRAALCLALSFLCAGCDEMVRQPKAPAYGRSDLFANGAAMQTAPSGTVSRDQAAFEAALTARPPMTSALLQRGRERYGIYCAPCHGLDGAGQGIIPARGFPRPPDLRSDPVRALSSGQLVQVIGDGYGVMYAYGDRVPPADRWAIAAYIRALQLAAAAPAATLSDADRAHLEDAHGG